MRALIGIVISMIAMIGISSATEISFSPDQGMIQPGCLVAADIIIDTAGQQIAATDVVIESSLEYVDFVPNKELFPYFFPPKIDTGKNMIHIVGFIANAKNVVSGKGSIGKIFLKQKIGNESDGTLKLYFAGQGKTYDSNLSALGGIDILDTVGSGYYRFVENGECTYPADYDIVGGFSHMSADTALKSTIRSIARKERRRPKNIILLSLALLLIIGAFISYKNYRKPGKGK